MDEGKEIQLSCGSKSLSTAVSVQCFHASRTCRGKRQPSDLSQVHNGVVCRQRADWNYVSLNRMCLRQHSNKRLSKGSRH